MRLSDHLNFVGLRFAGMDVAELLGHVGVRFCWWTVGDDDECGTRASSYSVQGVNRKWCDCVSEALKVISVYDLYM